jgi:hypothetical protein
MFQTLSRSWSLVKASAEVLKSDRELLVFPLVSAVATLLVAATFALPAIGLGLFESAAKDAIGPLHVVLGFAFYVCQYAVIFFFNTALVGAAMIRLDGGDPTLADGLRIARERLPAILGYAVIAATVGMVLQAIQERAGWVGRIVVGMIGMAWTLATAMVVPVLVAKNVGPIDAVKESASLLKRTWGENIVGNGGIGVVFWLISVAVIIAGVVLVVLAAKVAGVAGAIAAAVVLGLALVMVALVQQALAGIYAAALYRYATVGEAPSGFEGGVLEAAYRSK